MEIEPAPTPSGVSVKRRHKTRASLFIVESVTFEDEEYGRLEGDVLRQILHLSGKEVEYRYIRTKQELAAVLQQFSSSDLRYLHVSCHGNAGALYTTLDEIPFAELGAMLRPHLADRRLFVSACEAVNDALAAQVMRKDGCFSIVGPSKDVGFDEAAVMWAAFYHLIFKENPKAMKAASIEAALRRVLEAFEIPMTYMRRRSTRPFWREVALETD
jgi:hypothetical protein